jgi:hypothetical protein
MQFLIHYSLGKTSVLTFLTTFICIITFADIKAANTIIPFNAPPGQTSVTNISATRNRDQTINVTWTVANERNVQYYELQQSIDGYNFERIVTALPKADESGKCSYDRIDRDVFEGDNYYRVRIVDKNGRVRYSAVVKVGLVKGAAAINVYPNPVRNNTMQVQFINQEVGSYQLRLINQQGQAIYTAAVQVYSSNLLQTILFNKQVAPGVYQLTVSGTEDKKYVQQVIIE